MVITVIHCRGLQVVLFQQLLWRTVHWNDSSTWFFNGARRVKELCSRKIKVYWRFSVKEHTHTQHRPKPKLRVLWHSFGKKTLPYIPLAWHNGLDCLINWEVRRQTAERTRSLFVSLDPLTPVSNVMFCLEFCANIIVSTSQSFTLFSWKMKNEKWRCQRRG